MNRIERLTGIVMLLQARPWTAGQLADRFEISRRTILRDIDALSQLHVPVIAIPGRNGGYSLPADYSLPPVHLSDDEAMVLMLALRRFSPDNDSTLAAAARTATDKISAVLPASVRTATDASLNHLVLLDRVEAIDETVLATMRHAAAEGAWVGFDHERNGVVHRRRLLPREVQLADDRWYVCGVDADRRAERMFRLARVSSVHPIPPPVDAAEVVEESRAAAATYHAAHHPLVRFSLTPAGVTMAHDHPDFRNHLIGDHVEFRCPPGELPFYAREIISLGLEATILGGEALVIALHARIASIANHHGIR